MPDSQPRATVVVIGDSGCRLFMSLVSSLGQSFRITAVSPGMAAGGGEEPELLLCGCMPDCHISCPRPIVILSDTLTEQPWCRLPADAVVVCDSGCATAAEYAARCGCRALHCGLSNSDTLSLSSIKEKSAVISLRGAVADIFGCDVLPFELPAALAGRVKPYSVLAASAAAILSGRAGAISGMIF